MDTVRFALGDGDYADLYKELKHGTVKQVEAIYRPLLAQPDCQKVMQIRDEKKRMEQLLPILAMTDESSRAIDTIILNQVTEWSFGEVKQETLDNISRRKRDMIAQEANRLYEDPLVGISV